MKTLLADPNALHLKKIISHPEAFIVIVTTTQMQARCPDCQQPSFKVHSRYQRQMADLPWAGLNVRLHLLSRKFFCPNVLCHRRIFCERLPSVVAPYGRVTLRLQQALTLIGLAMGGRAGSRMAAALGMGTSAETLLRAVRLRAHDIKPGQVRVLGVDDWAIRKGNSYGTLLVDVERRRPIEMLPGREAATLAEWLKGQSKVEVVTRDRASYYADGVSMGAPDAMQVADRWHLLKNLREVVERVLQGHRRQLREAAHLLSPYREAGTSLSTAELPKLDPKRSKHGPSAKEVARQQQTRAGRLARWEEAKKLHSEGATISAISRRLGMHRETVRQFISADEYPEARPPGLRPSKVQPFAPYLKKRWMEGCHNARQLYREIKAQGYSGHVKAVQAYLEPWRELLPAEIRRMHGIPEVAPPAPRKVVWWLLKDEGELRATERMFIAELLKKEAVIKRARA